MNTPAEEFELTSEELEDVALSEGDLEAVEEEALEEESEDLLEDLEADLEGGFEDFEAQRPRPRPRPGSPTQKMLLRRLVKLFKKTVQNLLRNPRTARKLKDAIKKGPQATCGLICPLVCRAFPIFLRPLCASLCPVVCRRLFPWIRKVAKV